MKPSDRVRPEPTPIQKREEARANKSYIIVPAAQPKPVKKEHADGEAL